MRASRILLVAAFAGFFLFAGQAWAVDRITLGSGEVLKGTIVMDSPDLVVLELPGVGTIRIPRKDITKVEKDFREMSGSRVERSPSPEAEKPETHLLRYEDLKEGMEVLLILNGEDHEQWRTSGARHLCRIGMIGERRMKVQTSAGALGEVWVARDSIDRIVDVANNPDLLFMLFDGAQTGAWLRVTTDDGSVKAGRLEEVSEDGRVRLLVPNGETVEGSSVALGDIRSLQTIARQPALELAIASLVKGEPVAIHVWGRADLVTGSFAGRTKGFIDVDTGGEAGVVKVYEHAAITGIDRLPNEVRKLYAAVGLGDTITVRTTVTDERGIVSQGTTGELAGLSFEAVTLRTAAGAQEFAHGQVTAVDVPEESRLPALRGELEPGKVKGVPQVLPGMSEAQAVAALPERHPGLDLSCEDGKVVKVACRAPWSGSPFGLPIGGSLANATAATELVFDTQVEPEDGGFMTVESRSVKGLLITAFVSADGKILGVELTPR